MMDKTPCTRLRKYARRVKDKLSLHGISEHSMNYYEPFNYASVPLRTPSTQIRLLELFPPFKYSDPSAASSSP
ncbi:hypothetical protein SMACR_01979 [Sordaria macrospora]|uniref:WGS project CABT00000000 data, contig 2.5 n=2 Tax=Sordaria macrospora TaxID=5147 RepID=F7VSE9_SORMK|nr:uncharacterized protein SMAC_01979 [Sordaria macrospora k-hell]KAA8631042.1 hypothetical protein SMACR_01979 [Sordaria macrospora]WPJ63217.1 hypothetical protein SMAC4_01979 [Sordaria macrospora]CCC08435.1 unnamed protein product [Sordaria macrospora k-hell]